MREKDRPQAYWYALRTAPGEARRVAESLAQSLARIGLAGSVLEVRPPADVGEPAALFFVKMRWNAAVWSKLRGFSGVTGFLGDKNVPLPITDAELPVVMKRMARLGGTKTIVRIDGDGEPPG